MPLSYSLNKSSFFNVEVYSLWKEKWCFSWKRWIIAFVGTFVPTHIVKGGLGNKPEKDWNKNNKETA